MTIGVWPSCGPVVGLTVKITGTAVEPPLA
jgi:hypothetical protein